MGVCSMGTLEKVLILTKVIMRYCFEKKVTTIFCNCINY